MPISFSLKCVDCKYNTVQYGFPEINEDCDIKRSLIAFGKRNKCECIIHECEKYEEDENYPQKFLDKIK